MAERRDFDASEFADHLTAMTDDELFRLMQDLEKESDDVAIEARETSDAFAKIVLVETAIEDRFPGQLLAPYKRMAAATNGGLREYLDEAARNFFCCGS